LIEQVINDFKPYVDKYGLSQIRTENGIGCTTQNGTLFTVQYLICLLNKFDNKPDSSIKFWDECLRWDECFRIYKVLLSCQSDEGLTIRYPYDTEFDSMDNVSAILVFSYLFDSSGIASKIRNHGLNVICTGYDENQGAELNKKFYPLAKILGLGKVKNYWNNNNPYKFCFFSWFGRSPGFMGLIDICATGKTTWFRHLALLIGQFLGSGSDPQNTDARTMAYLIWQVLKHRNWFHGWLYNIWLKKLIKYYPNGMKDVYNIYYNRFGDNPDHPIVKHTGRD